MNSGFSNNSRTLSGVNEINVDKINIDNNVSAFTIKGDKGTIGQTIQKDTNNKLSWGFVDDIEIPDGSLTGAKLAPNISISTTGDITATNITATNVLKTNTTLDLPNSVSAIKITDGGGTGLAGQVLSKNNLTNKLEWDYVDDISIEDRSIAGVKLVEKTITDAEIADNAVITRTINDGAITNVKIADGTIENGKIKDGTIENGKIKDGTIENGKIKDGTIENGKIKDGTIENAKIKDGEISGGKLASDIVISTSGNITGATITAQDHFVQTTTNGPIQNTFTGGITTTSLNAGTGLIETTGNITSGDTIQTTNKFIQTGTQDNTFAGKLEITKAGNVSAPTQFSDGGFALQVGDASTNSDVYIKRNLIIDGLIYGNINGDVSDTHIETQSLLVHQLSAGGLEGIEVRDNFDIRMYDNNGHHETARIILDSSDADIRLNNAGSSETINLNGQTGNITLKKDGDIKLHQSSGDTMRILLDSSTGMIRLYNSSGIELLNLSGATGDITGSGGDVILEDGSGNETIRLDASAGQINATSVGGAGGFHIIGRGGIFDGYTVTEGGYTSKSFIENVDFGAFNNWNLPGRTWRKVWMPVKDGSGQQVNWIYQAVSSYEADNNWHDASGEYNAAGTMTGRGLLDINNRRIRTSKIKATITMNMACNYQLGFRLKYKTSSTLPISGAWTPSQEYLCLGDDWTGADGTTTPEYLGRKTWTWTYPLFPTTQGHYYSFRPEFFIKYAPTTGTNPFPVNHSRVQFWVGSAVGYAIPTENTNNDMPAIFEITEMPEEQTEYSDAAGTYPAALSSSSDDY